MIQQREWRVELAARLRPQLSGTVETHPRRRAEYTSDAGNYRLLPAAVIYPRDVADIVATIQFAREHGVPIAMRGAGTSIAGNAISDGFVLDTSRHLTTIHGLDPHERVADVDAGVVMGSLQTLAAPHGLRFGPDPSTWTRATFGGMIGNNACGPRAVAYGKTADNVLELDCIDGTGRTFTARAGELGSVAGLDQIVRRYLAEIRTELGTFSRQVSGYSLDYLLPERGADLPKMLVGTEASLVVVTRARLALVTAPRQPQLLVLGYPDMITAADDVPRLLDETVTAIEGFDARLVDHVIAAKGASAVPAMPKGGGWLLVEVADPTGDPARARARARELAENSHAIDSALYPPGAAAAALWKIRADGAGLGGRTPEGKPAWPGLEDAAVPPENLGAYLRDFTAELDRFGLDGLIYGHFGDGCVHVRIDFPLDEPDGARIMDDFMHAMAPIIARHGGSISGEHGDGRARSEVLAAMYSPALLTAFAEVKRLFDPDAILNPGVITDPAPLAKDLRLPQGQPLISRSFTLGSDGYDLGRAVHRCTGVGKCRVTSPGHVMCPSFRATGDEKDTTRARARILQEVANGSFVHALDSDAVRESLDLCLACKACSSDCPTGIDMARYKSEVLSQIYAGRRRPRTHYTLGWLPRLIRLLTATPLGPPVAAAAARAVRRIRPLERLVLRAAGMADSRELIDLESVSLTRWFRRRAARRQRPERFVIVWADTFSHLLDSGGAKATIELLSDLGYTVLLAPEDACCGLTYVTTGQLERARASQQRLLQTLAPLALDGVPIVGVEPSCLATLRDDLPALNPEDPRASAVAAMTFTLAEFLTHPQLGPTDFTPPDLTGVRILAQPHCHHYAVMGWQADHELLAAAGAEVTTVTGCCGMAGNFGMEADHAEVSRAVAETALLPALREHEDALVLADGFSCRTQIAQLSDRRAIHLAALLQGSRGMTQ